MVNDVWFKLGRASGAGCNCLIDTIRQQLDITADASVVRRGLRELFPSGPNAVGPATYLDLRAHWEAIVRLLGAAARPRPLPLDPQTMRFVCADIVYLGHGDVVGTGAAVFHLARTGANHFVPPIRM